MDREYERISRKAVRMTLEVVRTDTDVVRMTPEVVRTEMKVVRITIEIVRIGTDVERTAAYSPFNGIWTIKIRKREDLCHTEALFTKF